jgi:uracil-DNA glycosylase
MGQDALTCLNAVRFPLAAEIASQPGSIQKFTPTISALVTPDLDASLDEAPAKKDFWEAFKAIGPWWSEQPPY